MKLEKAIETLGEHVNWCDPVGEVETYEALKLGIEAMKAVESFRTGQPTPALWQLPGETED